MKKVERAALLQWYNNRWRRDSKGMAKEEEDRGQGKGKNSKESQLWTTRNGIISCKGRTRGGRGRQGRIGIGGVKERTNNEKRKRDQWS